MQLPARKFASYKCVGRQGRDENKGNVVEENEDIVSNSEKGTTEVIEKVV